MQEISHLFSAIVLAKHDVVTPPNEHWSSYSGLDAIGMLSTMIFNDNQITNEDNGVAVGAHSAYLESMHNLR